MNHGSCRTLIVGRDLIMLIQFTSVLNIKLVDSFCDDYVQAVLLPIAPWKEVLFPNPPWGRVHALLEKLFHSFIILWSSLVCCILILKWWSLPFFVLNTKKSAGLISSNPFTVFNALVKSTLILMVSKSCKFQLFQSLFTHVYIRPS